MAREFAPAMATCCTCGYKWRNGQDGTHTCSVTLLKRIDDLKKAMKHLMGLMVEPHEITPKRKELIRKIDELIGKM